ncbi:hypothetical protein Drorol1_Dr00015922 [Drosera rotundifolia]
MNRLFIEPQNETLATDLVSSRESGSGGDGDDVGGGGGDGGERRRILLCKLEIQSGWEEAVSRFMAEEFSRLWRGTNVSLALAIPTVGIYLPCYDIFRNYMKELVSEKAPYLTLYVPLLAGSVARSIACISCYPVELTRTRMQAFTETHADVKPPRVWQTLIGVVSPVRNASLGKRAS